MPVTHLFVRLNQILRAKSAHHSRLVHHLYFPQPVSTKGIADAMLHWFENTQFPNSRYGLQLLLYS